MRQNQLLLSLLLVLWLLCVNSHYIKIDQNEFRTSGYYPRPPLPPPIDQLPPPPQHLYATKELTPAELLVDLTNDLAFRILHYHSILNRNNFAFSPSALMSVLVALYEGSAGRSAAELRNVLQLPGTNVIRIGYRDIHRRLRTYFFGSDNPLKGLSLNKDNVTITRDYEAILMFYGYDLGMDMISSTMAPPPSSPAALNTSMPTAAPTAASIPSTAAKEEMSATISSSTTLQKPTTPMGTTEPMPTTLATTIELTTPTTPTTIQTPTTLAETTTTPTYATQAIPTLTTTTDTNIPTTTSTQTTASSTTGAEPTETVAPTTSVTTTTTTAATEPTEVATTTTTITPTTTAAATEPTEVATTTASTANTEDDTTEATTTNVGDGGSGGSELGALVASFVAEDLSADPPLLRLQAARVTRLPPPSKLQAPPLPPTPRANYLPSTRRVKQKRKEQAITVRRNKRHLIGHNKDLDANLFVALFDQQQGAHHYQQRPDFPHTANAHELNNDYAVEVQPHGFSSSGGIGVGGGSSLRGDIEVKTNLNTDVISHVFYLSHQQLIHTTFKVYNAVLYYKYFDHLKMNVLELELDTPEYNLMILLPDYHVDLVAAAASLRLGPTLRMMRKQLTPKWVQAIIPDFQLHGTMFLTNDLQNMGILDIFEPNRADFHPMTNENRIYVKHIEQSINVNIRTRPINNQLKHAYGSQTQPIQISVSHPFLFFVIDRELDVAVMSGRILNPQNVRIQ